jgi:site-specific recombinase XerD
VTVNEAADRFLADRESVALGVAQLGKYKHVVKELKASIGSIPLRNVTVDDVREIKETWKLSPITVQNRLEQVRKFFAFCVDSEWLERNPAKRVKLPPAKYDPTMRAIQRDAEVVRPESSDEIAYRDIGTRKSAGVRNAIWPFDGLPSLVTVRLAQAGTRNPSFS